MYVSMYIRTVTASGLLITSLLAFSGFARAASMDLQQVLQSVIDNYPSVETALLQVKQARLNSGKIQSQLGWQLQGQAGIRRDVSLFGTARDVLSLDGGWRRQFESGGSVGIDASVSRSEDEDSFLGVPNPTTSTSLELSYRQPLAKGADNPVYAESALQAKLDVSLAKAQKSALYDQLAEQIIQLYIDVAAIQIQHSNTEQTIARSLRRQDYLKNRSELGVAEQADLLQVDAQLKSQRAQLETIKLLSQSQHIRLNRLMGRTPYAEIMLVIDQPVAPDKTTQKLDAELIEQDAINHNAQLVSIDNRIQLADSTIRLRRNEQQDVLDLVMFVGSRTLSGDVISGGTSKQSELVGGVSIEFQQQYDKNAVDAEVEQALLDKDIALLEKKQLLEDIHYAVATLLTEINVGNAAIRAYHTSVRSERAKLNEAEKRYRTGRSDTEQLLAFETQLAAAELATENQILELLRDHFALQLLRGTLWQGIRLPHELDSKP